MTGPKGPALDTVIDKVVTDTRLLKSGIDCSHTVFIAIKGEKFDGNDFIGSAAEAGVSLIIAGPDVEKARNAIGKKGKTAIICCDDTLKAYGKIAEAYRKTLDVNVIGITGSVGKTTCKEFVYSALSVLGSCAKTPANHNNEIGVPRTILDVKPGTSSAVIEMGMRGRGQISFLAEIAKPHIGIITNIGTAHLELLGTKENTRLAKLEITDHMDEKDFLIVNGDDGYLAVSEEVLKEAGREHIPAIRTFGFSDNCFFRASGETVTVNDTSFELSIGGKFIANVTLGVTGIHYIYAALAGIAAAWASGAGEKEIKDKVIPAVSAVTPGDTGRQQIYGLPGGTLIDDCYNASPESMKAELEILERLGKNSRKTAFLGDMLELGTVSEEEHRRLGRICEEKGIDVVVCVGERAKDIRTGASNGQTEFIWFADSEEASEAADRIAKKGDTVLVKGSHSMKMGVISERIREFFSA